MNFIAVSHCSYFLIAVVVGCFKQAFIRNCHAIVSVQTSQIFVVMDIFGDIQFQEHKEALNFLNEDSKLSGLNRKQLGKIISSHHGGNGVQAEAYK